jgi:hypothetical protein
LKVNASLVNTEANAGEVALHLKLVDTSGNTVGKVNGTVLLKEKSSIEAQFDLVIDQAQLWSIPRPYLYTLTVQVTSSSGSRGTNSGAVLILDEVRIPVGLRIGYGALLSLATGPP